MSDSYARSYATYLILGYGRDVSMETIYEKYDEVSDEEISAGDALKVHGLIRSAKVAVRFP